MNFGFNEGRAAAEHGAKFFENECPPDGAAPDGTPEGISAERKKLAEQGWLGLIYPEQYDGTGLGLVTWWCSWRRWAARLARAHSPPCSLGGLAIPQAGRRRQKKEWLPRSRRATSASRSLDGADAQRPAGVTLTAVSAVKHFGHQALRARRPHRGRARGGRADAAGGGRRRRLALPPAEGHQGARGDLAAHHGPDPQALRGRVLRRHGGGRRPARGGGRGLDAALPRARPRHRGPLRRDVRGGPEGARHDGRVHAKIRQAFGRPIGSYQGVKHRAADMRWT